MVAANRPNIVLTSSSSTSTREIGQHLAVIDGRDYVDIDGEITAKHGEPSEISDASGDDHLEAIERELVASFAARRNLVISTSVRTMADPENIVALVGAEVFNLVETDAGEEQRFATVTTKGKSPDEVVDALRDAGASIGDGDEGDVDGSMSTSGGMDTTTRIFVYIIAAALAVLVVLLFLVLSF